MYDPDTMISIDMQGKSSISELSDTELVNALCETHEGKQVLIEYLRLKNA